MSTSWCKTLYMSKQALCDLFFCGGLIAFDQSTSDYKNPHARMEQMNTATRKCSEPNNRFYLHNEHLSSKVRGHGRYTDKQAPAPHCIFHQHPLKSILMSPFRSGPQILSTTGPEHSVDGRGGHSDGVSI